MSVEHQRRAHRGGLHRRLLGEDHMYRRGAGTQGKVRATRVTCLHDHTANASVFFTADFLTKPAYFSMWSLFSVTLTKAVSPHQGAWLRAHHRPHLWSTESHPAAAPHIYFPFISGADRAAYRWVHRWFYNLTVHWLVFYLYALQLSVINIRS